MTGLEPVRYFYQRIFGAQDQIRTDTDGASVSLSSRSPIELLGQVRCVCLFHHMGILLLVFPSRQIMNQSIQANLP